MEEVKEQLTEEELVYAEDLTIKAGESFDLETDYRGFQKNDEKVKVTFLKAEGDSGNSFDFNTDVYKRQVHILASALFNGLFETVRHDTPKEKAVAYVDTLRTFYSAGWFKILGIQ